MVYVYTGTNNKSLRAIKVRTPVPHGGGKGYLKWIERADHPLHLLYVDHPVHLLHVAHPLIKVRIPASRRVFVPGRVGMGGWGKPGVSSSTDPI